MITNDLTSKSVFENMPTEIKFELLNSETFDLV